MAEIIEKLGYTDGILMVFTVITMVGYEPGFEKVEKFIFGAFIVECVVMVGLFIAAVWI